MRRETADLIGSGLLLASLVVGTFATLALSAGASVASRSPAAAGAVAFTEVERGRALFSAKGCVSCHAKAGEPHPIAAVGPDLTDLAPRAGSRKPGMSAEAYVHESIKAPSAFIVPGYGSATFGMPDLGLSDDEIASLAAFLLSTP